MMALQYICSGQAGDASTGLPSVDYLLSNAPMSRVLPTIRLNPVPRWSVVSGVVKQPPVEETQLSPALMAGLPSSSAWVFVGPPLFANGPITGLRGEEQEPARSPVVAWKTVLQIRPTR